MPDRHEARFAATRPEFFVRTCGHKFVLTAICSPCRRYANWKLSFRLAARRAARAAR